MSRLRAKAQRLEKVIAKTPEVEPYGEEIPSASSLEEFVYGEKYLNLESVIFPELYKLLKLVNMDAPQE